MKKELFSVCLSRLAIVLVACLSVVRGQEEGPNGHYYKVVMEPNLLWEEAKAHAEQSTYNGVHGYLATITSAEEDQFIENLRRQAAPGGYGSLWVGGSQVGTALGSTDGWYWVNGEGPIPTRDGGDGYSNWQSGEPNDYWGAGSEGYLSVGHFNTFGWNDEPNDRHITGYVVEYPIGTVDDVRVVATDPIATAGARSIDLPSQPIVDPAVFTFSRSGDLSLDLPVYFSVHGTAANGVEYNEIAKSVIIPAGKSDVSLQIVPRSDLTTASGPTKTVGIRLEPSLILTPNAAYTIDSNHREAAAIIRPYGQTLPDSLEIAVPRNGFAYQTDDAVTFLVTAAPAPSVTQIPFYSMDSPDGPITLIGYGTPIDPFNGLKTYKLTWQNPPPGVHAIMARLSTDSPLHTTAVKITIPGKIEPPTVGIRFVEPTTTEPVPNTDFARGYLEVTRVGSTDTDLQVFYAVGGTATAGVDYEALQGYVVIPAGRSTAKITINAIDDTIDEPNETVVLTLTPPSNQSDATKQYTIAADRGTAQVVILDNDEPPAPQQIMVRIEAVDPYAVEQQPEGGQALDPASFRVTRSGDAATDLLVFYSVHGTAKNGEDYDLLPGSIKIPAGQASAEIRIVPHADTPSTGHKYEIVSEAGLSWAQAREKARQHIYLNTIGHLATITSAEEDATIESLRQEAGGPVLWVGGYQEPGELAVKDGWKWDNDEGPIPGTNGAVGGYAHWQEGEPNDYWGAGSENAMVIGWLNQAGWNDQGANVGAAGYVIEYDVQDPVVSAREIMETVGIRIEPMVTKPATPIYTIDAGHRTAGAVIVDGQPAADGELEIAIPSAGDVFRSNDDVEFIAMAEHPTMKITNVDFYVDDVKVGASTIDPASPGGGVMEHHFKWANAVSGEHTLQAKAILGGGRTLTTSRIAFTVEGVVSEPTVVSVYASDAEATEFPPNVDAFDPARFIFTRTGNLAGDLQVFYSVHGTAINGEDYERIASPVTIPAGTASVEVQIAPLTGPVSAATHKYEVIAEPNLTWEQARAKAEAMTFEGVKGHLATITSRAEDELIETLREQAGNLNLWVGGYQEPGEMSIAEGWKWVNNEGAIPGANNTQAGYANWTPGEPNDYWGPGSENYMVIGWGNSFGWNDQTLNILPQGYVVEFDVATSEPAPLEVMETVGIRIEPSPVLSPLPTYSIHETLHSAAAVIFEHSAPANGALEVAIPTGDELMDRNAVEFVVAGYHPTIDVSVVEFYVDEAKVDESTVVSADPISGGVVEHHFKWKEATSGQHILQAKAPLSNDLVLVSSRVRFMVNGPLNVNPVAKISKPADGATFLEADIIHAVAAGTDSDGNVVKIELLLDENVIASNEGATIEKDFTAAVGLHTLRARARDNGGAFGYSEAVHILVRHPDAVAFVHRELPAGYSPGVSFVVVLRADPPEGTFAYAVEDRPPTGWSVTDVTDDGAFDVTTGKVKFGPFTDDAARTLTYRVTPPANAIGRYEFAGSSSVNGALYPITGDAVVELVQQFHPADSNQDWQISLAEVTAYAAAWKAGNTWPTGPVPIPMRYVTRAHLIWQHGEVYRFEPAAGAPPACWVSGNSGPRAALAVTAGGAQRSVISDLRSGAAAQVQITATPAGGSSGYAVEEKPPRGWVVSNISNDGVFDAVSGTIRWGVFADTTTRTLSYTVTPPPTVTSVGVFAGQISFDGQVVEVSAGGGTPNSVTSSGATQMRINNFTQTATGTALNISGPTGQTAVIESSTDFTDWTEVKSIFIPNGSVDCTDDGATSGRRFYRLRAQ